MTYLEKCNKILLKSDFEINLESPVFLIQKCDYGCVMSYYHVIRWFKDRRVKPRKWIIPYIIIHLRNKCCRCIPSFILRYLVAWRHISKANACTAVCFFINHLQNVWQWKSAISTRKESTSRLDCSIRTAVAKDILGFLKRSPKEP